MTVTPLHRHQIAWLSRAGWQRVLEQARDPAERPCLEHWAAHGLPVVVTRQPLLPDGAADGIAVGISAPQRWERRRIALRVRRADVAYFDEFPRIDQIEASLPSRWTRVRLRRLAARLAAIGTTARVYGSHGWQHYTGLDHVRPGSDLDVWVAVVELAQADAAATALHEFRGHAARLDGELVFGRDTAVSWREWLAVRRQGGGSLLVKRLSGASMARASSRLLESTGATT